MYKPDIAQFAAVIDPHAVSCGSESDILKNSFCWVEPVRKLLSFFPHSMEKNLILADCAWECVHSWKRNPEKDVRELKVMNLKFFHFGRHVSQVSKLITCQFLADIKSQCFFSML